MSSDLNGKIVGAGGDPFPGDTPTSRTPFHKATMHLTEEVQLVLFIFTIFAIAIVAFWPLMPVFIWAGAIAVVLLPLHKRLCRIVPRAVSATFITLWVLLLILLVMALTLSVAISNEEHIGDMGVSTIRGLQHTALSRILPPFSEQELQNFDETLKDLTVRTIITLTGNVMQTLLSIFIFFLSLSMLLYYGETTWNRIPGALPPKLRDAVDRLSEISENTIYALIIVQISAAIISFFLAIPFFFFLGRGDVLLFAAMIGFAMLIPLVGAQVMILLLALYFFGIGDHGTALIMLFVGYPLLSGWIDFYYRPVMMGRRVAVHPVIMMIGIFGGVPFMGLVGFIVGPILIACVVVGVQILSRQYCSPGAVAS